jgi:hypothetical protein
MEENMEARLDRPPTWRDIAAMQEALQQVVARCENSVQRLAANQEAQEALLQTLVEGQQRLEHQSVVQQSVQSRR